MDDQAEELRRMCEPCPTCDTLRKLVEDQQREIGRLREGPDRSLHEMGFQCEEEVRQKKRADAQREIIHMLHGALAVVEWGRRISGADTCCACYAQRNCGHEPGCVVAAALNRSINHA